MVAVSAARKAQLGQLKGAIGRVLDGDKTVGTCFLVRPTLVVTCDHVIRRRERVDIWFEGAAERVRELGRTSFGEAADLAILEIPAQPGLQPIDLVQGPVWGASFDTFGYPVVHGGGGVSASGEIEGPTSIIVGGQRGSRFELRAARILNGFSGAPVLIAVGDRIMAAGAISDTGSESHPDVPSCAPISCLSLHPIGVHIHRWQAGDAGSPSADLSSWGLTGRLLATSALSAENEKAAIDVHAAIEAARRAASFDDNRIERLQALLAGLRTKYQLSPIDLHELLEHVKDARHHPTREIALQPTIDMIIADLQLIPADLLKLAAGHGAYVHRGVMDGRSFALARDAPKMPDPYVWENLERVIRSLVGLVEFDVRQLPAGFESNGMVRPIDRERLRALIAIARGYAPHLDIYADHGSTVTHVGRLVGRKTAMRNPHLYWAPSGPMALASSGGFLYRWRLDTPTPVADYRLAEDYLGIDEAFPFGDEGEPHLLVTTYAGPIAEVSSIGQVSWVGRPEWVARRLVWRDEKGHLVRCATNDGNTVLTLERDGDESVRTDLAALPARYPQLFEYPSERHRLADGAHRKVRQLHDLSREVLLGDSCVIASVLLDVGNALFFLDERTLSPLRAPVVTDLPIGRVAIAAARGKTLLLAPAICRHEEAGGLYAWDLSHSAGKQAAPFLGAKHEELNTDFASLAIASQNDSWDAYYVVHRLRGDDSRALCRLSWPELRPEVIVDNLGDDSVATVAALPYRG